MMTGSIFPKSYVPGIREIFLIFEAFAAFVRIANAEAAGKFRTMGTFL
jgi:hypothetical protein